MWNTMKIFVIALGLTIVAPGAAADPLDPTTLSDPTQTVDTCIIISPTKMPPVAIAPCNANG